MWIFFHDKSFNTIHYPLDSHNLEKYKLHAFFCTLKSYLKGKLDYKQFSMFFTVVGKFKGNKSYINPNKNCFSVQGDVGVVYGFFCKNE